jgi:hypothetical protein
MRERERVRERENLLLRVKSASAPNIQQIMIKPLFIPEKNASLQYDPTKKVFCMNDPFLLAYVTYI